MNKEKILRSGLFAAIGMSILAAWMKIMHLPGAAWLLFAALVFDILFIITAIPEVNRASKISRSEKIMWITGFIFLSGIAGLIYVFQGRKRVV